MPAGQGSASGNVLAQTTRRFGTWDVSTYLYANMVSDKGEMASALVDWR